METYQVFLVGKFIISCVKLQFFFQRSLQISTDLINQSGHIQTAFQQKKMASSPYF